MTSTCQCTGPGFCETFQREQSTRNVAICRGEVLTPAKCEAYRRNWSLLIGVLIAPLPATGPGTDLKHLIAEFGLKPTTSCACEAMLLQMNAWGVTGCREHRAEILAHLTKAYKSTANLTKLRAGLTALASHATAPFTGGAPLPLTLEGLLDEALRRAELAAASLPPEPPQNVANAGESQQQ